MDLSVLESSDESDDGMCAMSRFSGRDKGGCFFFITSYFAGFYGFCMVLNDGKGYENTFALPCAIYAVVSMITSLRLLPKDLFEGDVGTPIKDNFGNNVAVNPVPAGCFVLIPFGLALITLYYLFTGQAL